MLDVIFQINWFAVLAATVSTFVLGGVLYMVLFKTQYAASLGRTDLDDRKPAPIFIVGPLICGGVVNLTDAVLLRALDAATYGDALLFGAITGAGYLIAQTVNVAINPNFPRPLFYSAISGSYFLAANLMACAILIAMS